jgi:hypothetical protein
MLASTFQKNLKKLNPSLKIYCGDNKHLPAGIYHIVAGEYEEICGVEKNEVPEYSEYNSFGKMIKGGWRRVLQILIAKKLIDRRRSYAYFGHWDEHSKPSYTVEQTEVDKAIADMESRKRYTGKIESPLNPGQMVDNWVSRTDDVVDIGRMIRKQK